MAKFVKRFKRQWLNDDVVLGVFTILLGVLFVLYGSDIANQAVTIFGVFILVLSVLSFCWGDYLPSLIKGIFGGVIILTSCIFNTQPIVLPVTLFVYAVIQIVDCVFLMKTKKTYPITKAFACFIILITIAMGLIIILPIPYHYLILAILLMLEGLLMIIKGATKKI